MTDGDEALTHNYSELEQMDQVWQAAMIKAGPLRDDQVHMLMMNLRNQFNQQESLINRKNEEINSLRNTLLEMNTKLEANQKKMTDLTKDFQREQQEKCVKLQGKFEAKEKEVEEMRISYKQYIQDLTKGVGSILQELEAQLDEMKTNEKHYQDKIIKMEETLNKKQKQIENWDKVSDKMCNELGEVKKRLQSSKFANAKLREEVGIWKKYCQKAEEERKAISREAELERKVLNKFSEIDFFLKAERIHRNVLLDRMNNFGERVLEDIKIIKEQRLTAVELKTIDTQTEFNEEQLPNNMTQKDKVISTLSEKVKILEDELEKIKVLKEYLSQQNLTLRDVIKAMKKEREDLEKEKEQIAEEARVSKLEESVRLIKNNFIGEQKDVCVWSALQDVKKEVSKLKNKTLLESSIKAN